MKVSLSNGVTAPFRVHRVLLLVAAMLLASCYTFGGRRIAQRVTDGERTAVLGLWCHGEFFHDSDAVDCVLVAFGVLLVYPLELLLDVEAACNATFDETREVRGGPLGVVGGILLPWITLRPYLMEWDPEKYPLDGIELAPADYDRLLECIRSGDGLATFCELAGEHPRIKEVYAVEEIDAIAPPSREGARQ